MYYADAARMVTTWRKLKHDFEDRHGEYGHPEWRNTSRGSGSPGRTIDRFYAMTNYTEIYDAEAYEKCKQIIALRNMGFTPREIDDRSGWKPGTTGNVEYQHPGLLERARQVHIETAYKQFHQAKVRELEILASTVVPAVILLAQVVDGGAEFSPEEYQSRLTMPVSGQDVSLSNRITAAKTLLGFAQERMKAAVKEENSPLDELPPLPKEFTDRVNEAQGVALRLVPLAKEVSGK